MATCTFLARLEIEFRLLVPGERITALSRGTSGGTTEVTTRTTAFACLAANTWEARMGSAGSYDDADGTVGNQTAKGWGTRYMMAMYRDAFALTNPDGGFGGTVDLVDELERYHAQEVASEGAPVVYDVDGEEVTE